MASQSNLTVALPPYCYPRNEWRHQIHQRVMDAANELKIVFQESDKVEVIVRLYLSESALCFHDIDNRLKDIFDALQGRAGGPKNVRSLAAIIPNDKQIFRALIEKAVLPPNNPSGGELTIKKLEGEL